MIKSYLLIAWRTTIKNRLFSFINIVSLSLSISLCMIVVIHLLDTFRYDNFHADSTRIYRIISDIKANDGREWTLASSPLPLKETLVADDVIFSNVTSLYPGINGSLSDNVKDIPVRGAFTQPSFFEIFGFTLEVGDATTALTRPNTIVLSNKTAKKFFDNVSPVGQTMTIDNLGTFEITGVMDEPPSKSHIDFDVFVSFETVASLESAKKLVFKSQSWDSFENAYTYVKLSENSTATQLNERLSLITKGIAKKENSGTFTFRAQSLASITPMGDELYNDIGRGSTWGKLLAEIGIAFIILLAACFNYTNLSIARSLTRTKEVGIRKMAGAQRWQIFNQYLVESILVALLSLCFAYVILEIILAYNLFNEGYEFIPDIRFDFTLLISFVGVALFVGMMAGIVPATLLSSLNVIKLLRKIGTEKVMGGISLRKALLVFQFSLSLIVIIFLSVFDRQFEFMSASDPGYRMDDVISLEISSNEKNGLARQLSMLPQVEMVGTASGNFGRHVTGAVPVSHSRNDQQAFKMDFYFADAEMIALSGLTFVSGRNFQHDPAPLESGIIINEKALTGLGYKTADDAVGQTVFIEDSVRVRISGVVKDFYNAGVGNTIRPLMLRQKEGKHTSISLLISKNADRNNVRLALEAAWKKIYPDKALTYQWLREEHNRVYEEMGSVSLLGFLAFMTVAIATLGLLGLVVYTVETRRKEISIRKIVGASTWQVTHLLSGGFVKLLFISGTIALPIAYALSELFLMNFVNKISVSFTLMLAAFVFLLAIGLLMIGSQTAKAALENPAKNLRSE